MIAPCWIPASPAGICCSRRTPSWKASIFHRDAEPEQIGHKALGRCLSDIAAMAGRPIAALITMALPANFDPAFVAAHLRRDERAGASNMAWPLSAGKRRPTRSGLLISVACWAMCARGQMHACGPGRKAGDALFVTGELGGSLAGKHLEFEPRLAEARWLAEHFPIHAMIDLSDGLAGDLRHLLDAQPTSARNCWRRPSPSAARRDCRPRPNPPPNRRCWPR